MAGGIFQTEFSFGVSGDNHAIAKTVALAPVVRLDGLLGFPADFRTIGIEGNKSTEPVPFFLDDEPQQTGLQSPGLCPARFDDSFSRRIDAAPKLALTHRCDEAPVIQGHESLHLFPLRFDYSATVCVDASPFSFAHDAGEKHGLLLRPDVLKVADLVPLRRDDCLSCGVDEPPFAARLHRREALTKTIGFLPRRRAERFAVRPDMNFGSVAFDKHPEAVGHKPFRRCCFLRDAHGGSVTFDERPLSGVAFLDPEQAVLGQVAVPIDAGRVFEADRFRCRRIAKAPKNRTIGVETPRDETVAVKVDVFGTVEFGRQKRFTSEIKNETPASLLIRRNSVRWRALDIVNHRIAVAHPNGMRVLFPLSFLLTGPTHKKFVVLAGASRGHFGSPVTARTVATHRRLAPAVEFSPDGNSVRVRRKKPESDSGNRGAFAIHGRPGSCRPAAICNITQGAAGGDEKSVIGNFDVLPLGPEDLLAFGVDQPLATIDPNAHPIRGNHLRAVPSWLDENFSARGGQSITRWTGIRKRIGQRRHGVRHIAHEDLAVLVGKIPHVAVAAVSAHVIKIRSLDCDILGQPRIVAPLANDFSVSINRHLGIAPSAGQDLSVAKAGNPPVVADL